LTPCRAGRVRLRAAGVGARVDLAFAEPVWDAVVSPPGRGELALRPRRWSDEAVFAPGVGGSPRPSSVVITRLRTAARWVLFRSEALPGFMDPHSVSVVCCVEGCVLRNRERVPYPWTTLGTLLLGHGGQEASWLVKLTCLLRLRLWCLWLTEAADPKRMQRVQYTYSLQSASGFSR